MTIPSQSADKPLQEFFISLLRQASLRLAEAILKLYN